MFGNTFFSFLKDLLCFAGYLNNYTAFPKALSEEKQNEYIQKYKAGDMHARDALIEHNLRLVAHIAKKYANTNIDQDDLISIGTIGLIKAIGTFDFQKGKLATYAARCVENELLMFIRANKKVRQEISLEDPIGRDKEGNNISLMDVLCVEESGIVDQVQLNMQTEKLNRKIGSVLTPREKTVIELRYGLYGQERITQQKAADKLGISRSYISRIEKRALQKLAKEFREKY